MSQELTVRPNLSLCGLVPKPPSPKQNFRIMQRAAAANVSRTSGTMGDESGQDSAASRYRTLEEKQADYELARQRIYGDIMKDGSGPLDEQGPADGEEARGRTARRHEEEPNPVPQHIYESAGVMPAVFQPVYPSLYHPPKSDQHSQAASLSEDHSSSSNFAFAPNGNHYPAYPQMPPMQSLGGYPNGAQMSNGYTSNSQLGQPQYLVQQSYGGPSLHSHSTYMGQPVNNFGQTWQEGPPSEAYPAMMPPNQPANLMPGQLAMYAMPMPGQGWAYQSGMQQMTGHGYPMPMIPQGMQPYQPIYQYPIQQGMYPNLVQPTPMRPNPYPHSSSASSISSRSYHDHSRPHSRGSTTSTRSAASSVRLGAMYPAGHPPSYRQKGLKGQSFNGMTSFGLGERRSTRGHSPVSSPR